MVHERLDGVVIFMANLTLMTDVAVGGFMLYQMSLVDRFEFTLTASVELTCMLPHVCI